MIKTTPKLYYAVYLILLVLCLLPIWTQQYLPLQDYPNHLARSYIFSRIGTSDILSTYYDAKLKLVPNLAMDLIVPPLASLFNIFIAGKLFISISLTLITSGGFLLYREIHRKSDIFAFAPFLFLYNQILSKGFLNYLFGVGLLMWTLYFWVKFRENHTFLRSIFFAACGFAVYISHLSAFGLLVIMIFGIEFPNYIRLLRENRKTLFISLVPFISLWIIPFISFFFSDTASASIGIHYEPILYKFTYYVRDLFIDPGIGFLSGMLLLGIVFIAGVIKEKIVFHYPLLYSLIISFIVYLAMPSKLISTSHADWRLLFPIVILFFTAWSFSSETFWLKIIFTTISLALVTVNIISTGIIWEARQETIENFVEAIEHTESGERIATLFLSDSYPEIMPYIHYPTYAVMLKESFIPSLFSYGTQQPLSYNKSYADIKDRTPELFQTDITTLNLSSLREDYDYLIIYSKESTPPLEGFTKIYNENNVSLFH